MLGVGVRPYKLTLYHKLSLSYLMEERGSWADRSTIVIPMSSPLRYPDIIIRAKYY